MVVDREIINKRENSKLTSSVFSVTFYVHFLNRSKRRSKGNTMHASVNK